MIDGPKIVSCDPSDAGADVETVDVQGATVLPAFADCHVHLTDTGFFLGARNLNGARSYDEFAAAVAALPRERFVFAGQYDESVWRDRRNADAAPLEGAFPDSYAMLVRIDGHSCMVNRKTLHWLNLANDIAGIERNQAGEPTGKLLLDANWQAQKRFMEELPLSVRRDAEARATGVALQRGCLHLHVQLVGFAREQYAAEIKALPELGKAKWYPKICEPDPELARDQNLPYIGGDIFLDGSIGSCTAAVSKPFLTPASGAPGDGILNFRDDELYAFFSRAHTLGVSAGVHAIGDRAIEQCIATWERVLGGKPSPNGFRPFIEHFEIARDDHIERCARLGIYLSMQPQFDLLWGGDGKLYERRLGADRMRKMNALGRAERAGAILCGGDDSPVCELSPLLGMHAAVNHNQPAERLTPQEALTMYTCNAAKLAHAEDRTGMIAPGYAADLAVLDGDPFEGADFAQCRVLATWRDGEAVYEA